jgi:hypothetical protein
MGLGKYIFCIAFKAINIIFWHFLSLNFQLKQQIDYISHELLR